MMPRFKKGPTHTWWDLARWVFWSALFAFLAGYLLSIFVGRASAQVPGLQVIEPGDFPVEHRDHLIEVGRELFFDPLLSANGQVSCSSCHDPDKNFTDGVMVAIGNFGKQGSRNSPSCRNTGYWLPQFWGGAALGLEAQAQGPLENPLEMADRDNDGDADQTIAEVVDRLQPKYGPKFKSGVMTERIFRWALAAYQRSLVSGPCDYDRWVGNGTIDNPHGPVTALTSAQRRGAKTFSRYCKSCHIPPLFTDAHLNADPFHVTGSTSSGDDDNGRQGTTANPADFKRYKTPSLRDVTRTAPYGVGGNWPTLESRLDFYNSGGGVAVRSDGAQLSDGAMPPAGFLTEQDKHDLLQFLEALETNGELNR